MKMMLLNLMVAMQNMMFLDTGETFISQGIDALKYVVMAVGGGILVLGVIGLLEGYGNDNPGAKSQGMKQTMAGAAIILVGAALVPKLKDLTKGWKLGD